LEVYVDDIMVKTRKARQLMANLKEMTISNLQASKIKLNLKKCVFGSHPRNYSDSTCPSEASKPNPTKSLAL